VATPRRCRLVDGVSGSDPVATDDGRRGSQATDLMGS
jgi:hypothetical protein